MKNLVFKELGEKKSNNKSISRKPYKVFRPFYSPKNISELVSIAEFMDIVNNGFTFIQYRKDSVYHLSEELFSNSKKTKNLDTHLISIKESLSTIIKNSRDNNDHILWVIDSTRYNENLSSAYEKMSKIKKAKNTGVCVRENIEDIEIKALEFFDILFLFDMSNVLFDKLRSFISIPDIYIEKMRSGKHYYGEPVIVFINYKRLNIKNIPYFSTNPFILSCDSSLTSVGKKEAFSMSKSTFNFNGPTNAGAIGDKSMGTYINNPVSDNFETLIQQADMLLKTLSENNDESAQPVKEAKAALVAQDEPKAIESFKKLGKTIITVATTIGATILAEWLKIHVFQS